MCGAAWEPRSKAHPVCRSLQPGVRDTNKLPLPESSTAKVYNPLNKDNNNPLNSPGCYPRETVQICYMSRTPGKLFNIDLPGNCCKSTLRTYRYSELLLLIPMKSSTTHLGTYIQ